ncbi:MAG: hypothetical protein AB1611_03355 [bacterium]
MINCTLFRSESAAVLDAISLATDTTTRSRSRAMSHALPVVCVACTGAACLDAACKDLTRCELVICVICTGAACKDSTRCELDGELVIDGVNELAVSAGEEPAEDAEGKNSDSDKDVASDVTSKDEYGDEDISNFLEVDKARKLADKVEFWPILNRKTFPPQLFPWPLTCR